MQRRFNKRTVWIKWTKGQALFTECTSEMMDGAQKEMRFIGKGGENKG